MLRRSFVALALCALAGCQDYNFNPVGKCVIQPGSSRIKLSAVSTADVLFVVDDSGSMAPEQASLARNFGTFVSALAQTQQARTAAGLEPFDFHLAITTSSIFEGWLPSSGTPTCTGSPLACNISSSHYTTQPSANACTDPADSGLACDDLVENYFVFAGCSAGLASNNAAYPQGNFVAAAGNPAVLHFTKDVWSGTATANATLATLSTQFQQNINVGTCGSGMEQHFEAGKLAVEKAIAGKQPGVAATEWPHANSKLVVVWLGDEDDCSNPNDPAKALGFDPKNFASSNPGSDVCIADQEAATHKMFALDRYVKYFTGLDRPFGAAFIYSAVPSTCQDDGQGDRICTPGTCTCQCPAACTGGCSATAAGECNIPSNCGGWIPPLPVPGGSRYAELSTLLRGQGVKTFEASVCEANWGNTLQGIAKLLIPPAGLTLPTQPAATQVALVRIESADGKTSRYCTGPALTQADLATFDWWFVDCKTGQPVLGGATSSCININHATGHCEPNPGESYVAQYLGIVPTPTADNPLGGCAAASDCQKFLGGQLSDWQCTPAGNTGRGTCTCGGATP
ncbi:MAG TPA: hypothetical protein VF805_06740 [Anaeromyxobacteraceae bacterium]